MTLHVVPKTQRPTPPPPHITAFAWTEERGLLVPAWTGLASGVLVPWDQAFMVRALVYRDDAGGYVSETVDERGCVVGIIWITSLVGRLPSHVPTLGQPE